MFMRMVMSPGSFTSLTTQLLSISVLLLQRQQYHNRGLRLNQSNTVWWNNTYDYVIVGGGTGGCVLASRLTENPDISVLIIEEGGPVTISSDITATFLLPERPSVYQTTPQRFSMLGLDAQRPYYARPRMLGGSSSLNFVLYLRGNPRDYDAWSTVHGASGWSFNEVMPYFLRSENNTDSALVQANAGYHSTKGLQQVSTIPNPDPILSHWNEAARRMGWSVGDLNGPVPYTSAIVQTIQSPANWTRQSTYSAFIEPVLESRKNLHILLNSRVLRILFDDKVAVGVEFLRNNATYHQVIVRREVIVSGGSVGSPQLLLLSGVGPRAQLEHFNIPVVANLPAVGEHLIDPLVSSFEFLVRNDSLLGWLNNTNQELNAKNLYQFLAQNTGPLTRLGLVETYTASGINGDKNWPDGSAFLMRNPYATNIDETVQLYRSELRPLWKRYLEGISGNQRRITMYLNLFRPLSRGTVRLASSNPLEVPLMNTNSLSNPRDLFALVATMSTGLSIAQSEYMQNYMQLYATLYPGCEACMDGTPAWRCYRYLACVALKYATPTAHPMGTCRMGNRSSPAGEAVVDERLRVLGDIEGLRVVDASVMPGPASANANAPVIMIAERAADLIRQDNRHC